MVAQMAEWATGDQKVLCSIPAGSNETQCQASEWVLQLLFDFSQNNYSYSHPTS